MSSCFAKKEKREKKITQTFRHLWLWATDYELFSWSRHPGEQNIYGSRPEAWAWLSPHSRMDERFHSRHSTSEYTRFVWNLPFEMIAVAFAWDMWSHEIQSASSTQHKWIKIIGLPFFSPFDRRRIFVRHCNRSEKLLLVAELVDQAASGLMTEWNKLWKMCPAESERSTFQNTPVIYYAIDINNGSTSEWAWIHLLWVSYLLSQLLKKKEST